jgi:hypothetical protein
MNTHKILFRLAAVVGMAMASSALALAIACSGDDNHGNPAPTQRDSGGPDSTMPTGDDGGNPPQQDAGTDATPIPDASCSDSSKCNSCTTQANDPLNSCSPYTANCIPFDPSRVPTHPSVP